MKIIKITWKGLIGKNGEICESCRKTYLNIESALIKLEPVISNLGMRVVFEKKDLSEENFGKDFISSNRVFIDGEPIEDILNLKVGKIAYCKVCKNLECRTIIDMDKETNEIPEKYILAAIFTKIKERF
ncbi:MAG: DUF2703 domain-containing protein [Thermodesulfobacterium sp.]|nr:DUF2703 domain-containing protein [Thermodesulfobacterium sp.]